MPKITKNGKDQDDPQGLENTIESMLGNLSITTQPVMICGVNRKANIGEGSYESLDVYNGIAIPMGDVSMEDIEKLKEIAHECAAVGFDITSKQTYDRYAQIKDLKEEQKK